MVGNKGNKVLLLGHLEPGEGYLFVQGNRPLQYRVIMIVKDEGYSGAQEKPLTQTGGVGQDLLTKSEEEFSR